MSTFSRRLTRLTPLSSVRRASTVAALATRKQAFKEHLHSLRAKDPERWTTHALAHHFNVPLANVQAMLALQDLEKGYGELDQELVTLADDAEEYLDSENGAPPAHETSPSGFHEKQLKSDKSPSEAFYDLEAETAAAAAATTASGALEAFGPAQEQALIAAVAQRFGVASPPPGVSAGEALGAALHEMVGGLSLEELGALEAQLRGGGGEPAGAAAAAAGDDGDDLALARARRSLLGALCHESPPAPLLVKGGAAVEIAALGLPEVDASQPLAPARSASSSSSAAATAKAAAAESKHSREKQSALDRGKPTTAFVNPPDAFWVDNMQYPPQLVSKPAVSSDEGAARPFGADTDGLVTNAHWGNATTPRERMATYHDEPDFGDTLRKNVDKRARFIGRREILGGFYPFPKKGGRILFTDVARPTSAKVAIAQRVWVAVNGQGVVEPSAREAREAALRAQPPILKPRIKRNMLVKGTHVEW